jgi:hypothetical protein
MFENLHSTTIKLFKSGVMDYSNLKGVQDLGYIADDHILNLAQKFVGIGLYNDHFASDEDYQANKNNMLGKITEVKKEGEWIEANVVMNDEGIQLLQHKKGISPTFDVTNLVDNTEQQAHDGFVYEYCILDIIPREVAIVDRPRFSSAGLKINSLDKSTVKVCFTPQEKNLDITNKDQDIVSINDNQADCMFSKRKVNESAKEEMETKEKTQEQEVKTNTLDLTGKKVNGMEGNDFLKKVMNGYDKKYNEITVSEENQNDIITIEVNGEMIELTLAEAVELAELGEEAEDAMQEATKENEYTEKEDDKMTTKVNSVEKTLFNRHELSGMIKDKIASSKTKEAESVAREGMIQLTQAEEDFINQF